MLDVSSQERAIIEQILRAHVPNATVWAFGSRVTGHSSRHSDLDLAIATPRALSIRKKALLREAFENSLLPYRTDIVDWHTASDSFRTIIRRDARVIQRPIRSRTPRH